MGLFWANNSGNDGWETEISLCTMTALEMFKMFTNALIGKKKTPKSYMWSDICHVYMLPSFCGKYDHSVECYYSSPWSAVSLVFICGWLYQHSCLKMSIIFNNFSAHMSKPSGNHKSYSFGAQEILMKQQHANDIGHRVPNTMHILTFWLESSSASSYQWFVRL